MKQIMNVSRFGLLFACAASAAAGCQEAGPPAASATATTVTASSGPASARASADPETAAFARAEAAIGKLAGALQIELGKAMKEGGPPAAIRVCADRAPELATQVSRDSGVKLGRASLRLRNAANRPPAWVKTWLDQQGERKAAGVATSKQVVDTPTGRAARIIRPIAVGAVCVRCHGGEVDPKVEAVLKERYPKDAARGYAAGDLRGAFWAQAPLKP